MNVSNNFEYGRDANVLSTIKKWKYGENWPVVYIIYNSKNAYVGETLDISRRTEEHLYEDKFDGFSNILLISDDDYNKSAILDLESFLIRYIGAEGSRKLLNGNSGIEDHNFYNKKEYEKKYELIWEKLLSRGIVKKTLKEVENSELFKYSPYKTLNTNQKETLLEIIEYIFGENNHNRVLVNGGAGTGKTILAVFLIKLLVDYKNNKESWIYSDDYYNSIDLQRRIKNRHLLQEIGFVVPMSELRQKMKSIFKSVEGLSEDMILAPEEVVNKKYDLLIVDEAHRLYKRKSLPSSGQNAGTIKFDKINKQLMGSKFTGTENDYTELDWIIKSSKKQILFYDRYQSIRITDIGHERFSSICNASNSESFELISQMRCKGGNGYYEYIRSILFNSGTTEIKKKKIDNYHLEVFDNVKQLFSVINDCDRKYGLCHVVSGPSWTSEEKILIDGVEYQWYGKKKKTNNMVYSIHKSQGFDLNYAGVIFGKEIYYDNNTGQIKVNRHELKDNRAKPKNNDELTREFVLNIYLTLMTRGIEGTYVYAMDENLNKYLKQLFNNY